MALPGFQRVFQPPLRGRRVQRIGVGGVEFEPEVSIERWREAPVDEFQVAVIGVPIFRAGRALQDNAFQRFARVVLRP